MIKVPGPGEMELYDNVVPAVPARDYRVVVEQTVGLPTQYEPPSEPYRHVQKMRVAGPHLGLDPGAVVSFYPPANGQAQYGSTLPHVVLARPTLPWEIAMPPPGEDARVAPWLAVLLLTPGEWDPVNSSLTGARSLPLREYLQPPAGVLGPAFTPARIADMERDEPDRWVVAVDVRLPAFEAIAPELRELPYLAHARQVDVDDQEIDGSGEDGWFAVVVGNRLPLGSPDGTYAAHLVSLEGFAGDLPGSGSKRPGVAVRLLSLASWTFNSLEGGASFAEVMHHLDDGLLRMPGTLLPDPTTEPERSVRDALDIGYTALRYETRFGPATVGWYRGPALPVPMEPNPQDYPGVEAALVYDAATGMFDVSFAVAWETGRMMALADRPVTRALVEWVRANLRGIRLAGERLELFEKCPAGDAGDVAGLLSPDLMRRLGLRSLSRWSRRIAPVDPDARPLLGEPRDPSGLRGRQAHAPGLLTPSELERILSAGGDPARAALERIRRGR